jgi:hypothetical protein
VWHNINNLKKIEELTNIQFASQIGVAIKAIPVDPSKVIEVHDRYLVKNAGSLFPDIFISQIPRVLQFPTNYNLAIIKPMIPFIRDKKAIARRLAEIGTPAAIMQLANSCFSIRVTYPILQIHHYEFDLSAFTDSFVLKFFGKLANPALTPSRIWQIEITSLRDLRRIIKLAKHSSSNKLLEILIDNFNNFPNTCLDSFFSSGITASTQLLKRLAHSIQSNRDFSVRYSLLQKLHEMLKKPSTDVRFLAIFGLALKDPKVAEFAEDSIEYHVRLRKETETSVLAEYCLPLFFVLNGPAGKLNRFLAFFNHKTIAGVCKAIISNGNDSSAKAISRQVIEIQGSSRCSQLAIPHIFLNT